MSVSSRQFFFFFFAWENLQKKKSWKSGAAEPPQPPRVRRPWWHTPPTLDLIISFATRSHAVGSLSSLFLPPPPRSLTHSLTLSLSLSSPFFPFLSLFSAPSLPLRHTPWLSTRLISQKTEGVLIRVLLTCYRFRSTMQCLQLSERNSFCSYQILKSFDINTSVSTRPATNCLNQFQTNVAWKRSNEYRKF